MYIKNAAQDVDRQLQVRAKRLTADHNQAAQLKQDLPSELLSRLQTVPRTLAGTPSNTESERS